MISEKLEVNVETIVSTVKSICLMCVQSCKRKVSLLLLILFSYYIFIVHLVF